MKEQCLNGKWDFRPDGEECFSEIYVPSQWTHGDCFGYPKSWESVKKADYSREVLLPEFNSEEFLSFRFDSVMIKCLVFFDGVKLGGHAGGFTPFELRVPELLWKSNSGQKVVLTVEVESAVAAFTDEGVMHQVGYPDAGEEGALPGGIWQSVFLRQKPKLHVASWNSKFSFSGRKSVLECVIENSGNADFSGRVEFAVCDLKSGKASQKYETCLSVQKRKEERALWKFVLPGKFKLWSAFEPNLYALRITIYDSNGCALESLSDRIGFRESVVKGRNIILNGDVVHMFGLSLIRQRVSPYLWREDYLRLYFSELKKMGFNALRLHGAIAPPIVLKLADELGIMLINQSSIWTGVHAGYRKGGRKFLNNTKREFAEWHTRDRNHPSVLIWDVENEQISVDVKNVPWVNELIRYMRDLTGQPISASASGSASESDIAHIHCAINLNRLLKHAPNKPFFAGEWWGPEKEYRQKMHTPTRKLNDLKSMEDIEECMGLFHEKEILLERSMGVAGTFPFGTELFFFRQLFKKGEKLNASSDDSGNNPLVKFADDYHGYSYHTPRRPLVNPGWDKSKPEFIPARKMINCFKRALAPVVIVECEENRDFYGGSALRRSFKLLNDSGKALSGALTAEFFLGKQKQKLVLSERSVKNLKIGSELKFAVEIDLPEVAKTGKGKLTLSFAQRGGDKVFHCMDCCIWPGLPELKSGLPVYVVGVDKSVERFLKERGIAFSKASNAPDHEAVLVVGAKVSGLKPDDCSDFIAKGGRIVVLRQNSRPDFIAQPFRFKSASEPARPVLEGIQRELKQLNFSTTSRIFEKKHKVFSGMPCKEIRPFAKSDFRVIDDAYSRPCISNAVSSGPYKILAEGADRSQVALAELDYSEGLVFMCQFLLEENLSRDPQADRLLFNILDYAFEFKRASGKRIVCPERKLAKELACIAGQDAAALSGSLDEDFDVAFLAQKEDILKALSESEKENSKIHKRIAAGGVIFALVDKFNAKDFSSYFDIVDVEEDAPLMSLNSVEHSPFGWNSLDIEKALPEAPLRKVLTAAAMNSDVDAYSHSYDDPYGGASIGGKLGSVLLSRKIGKGAVYVTSLSMGDCDNSLTACLWHSLLASLDADGGQLPELEGNAVVSVPTPPLPLDGDLLKWFNEEEDKHIAPWSRAESVLLDANGMVKDSGTSLEGDSSGAVCSLMHDKENLYFSAYVISDGFDFKDVEVFTYNKDSVQVFLNNVQFTFSAREDGSFFVDTRGLAKGAQKHIKGHVSFFDDISACPDVVNLRLERDMGLKAFFVEARIPLNILPFELSDAGSHELAIALNIAKEHSGARLVQYSFPRNFIWDDRSTFGQLSFRQKI